MSIHRQIRTDQEHVAALREIGGLMRATAGTPEGDRLDFLVTLVEIYESKRWPIETPDPSEAGV